ncbi:MAG: hypothetical protein IPL40_16360 [Proteobacteria bacterium]|nr:hypothetical protein [Pseudomonadota bacterium]
MTRTEAGSTTQASPTLAGPGAHPRRLLGLVLACRLLAGCASAAGTPPVDAGTRLDAVRLPDLALGDSALSGVVGSACGGDAGACPRQAICLRIADSATSVCGLPGCTRDDVTTARREDNCPTQTACTAVTASQTTLATTACLPACSPVGGAPCALRALSCDPLSVLRTGTAAVCDTARCSVDADCGDHSAQTPDVRCDADAGVCRNLGRVTTAVGAACSGPSDCGAGQHCLTEWPRAAAAMAPVPGGYCTVVGCRWGGAWRCPSGSACFSLGGGSGGLSACLAGGCDPRADAARDGCRDDTPAQPYLCFAVGPTSACWLDPAAPQAL